VTAAEGALREAIKLFDTDGQQLSGAARPLPPCARDRATGRALSACARAAADECRLRVADLLARDGARLARAAAEYEALAAVAAANSMGLGGGRTVFDLWQRAALCRLAAGDVEGMDAGLARSAEGDVSFSGSTEAERLRALRDAVVAADADAFGKEVRARWDGGGDPVTTALLARVRLLINREGAAGERCCPAPASQRARAHGSMPARGVTRARAAGLRRRWREQTTRIFCEVSAPRAARGARQSSPAVRICKSGHVLGGEGERQGGRGSESVCKPQYKMTTLAKSLILLGPVTMAGFSCLTRDRVKAEVRPTFVVVKPSRSWSKPQEFLRV